MLDVHRSKRKTISQCRQCRCVGVTPAERCAAIQDLVRPADVSLIALMLAVKYRRDTDSNAEAVSFWLTDKIASGRLNYIPDPDNCDQWCAPMRTMRYGGGDCDDFAILGASLLLSLNVNCDVIIGKSCRGSSCGGHAWVEGWDQYGAFLIEATTGELYRYLPQGYVREYAMRPGQCRPVR